MRIAIPFGSSAVSSQPISLNPSCAGEAAVVTISNTSSQNVWIGDDQNKLDSSVDNTGTPNNGILFTPNMTIATIISTGLWARSNAAGAFVDIWIAEICTL